MKFQFYQQVLKHISIYIIELFAIMSLILRQQSLFGLDKTHKAFLIIFTILFTAILIINIYLEIKKFRENYRNQYKNRKD